MGLAKVCCKMQLVVPMVDSPSAHPLPLMFLKKSTDYSKSGRKTWLLIPPRKMVELMYNKQCASC
jgi:hypothetical protein